MTAGIKANVDGSAAIQVGGTDVITLTSGGAATFVTSPTTVQAGTAAAPSITFSGDTNTGIYSPGADTVGLTAGGTLVGSVGLGTTLALQGATSQSGTGITFPATQSASSDSNTLDDYEEGTWTPEIEGTTVAGTGTYTTQNGKYTKIGNAVTIACTIVWTAHTGTGNIRIRGLPFTTASSINPSLFIVPSNITVTGQVCGLTNAGATTITVYSANSGALAQLAMDTAGTFYVSVTYYV